MQVTETSSEGLRREFRVVVPVDELEGRVAERLGQLKDRVRIDGFRPGKVPVAHLKRIYGKAAMAEAIEAAMRDVNAKIVTDNGFRLAMEPQVTLPSEKAEVDDVIAGKSDLSYTVAMEILPPIALTDFKTIELQRPVAEASEAEVDEGVQRIASQNRPFSDKGADAKAEKDDRVTISFVGRIDGEPFEGGAAEDLVVQLGSGTFIPGFEDQLVGIAPGETRMVKTTFPATYPAAALAGKEAEFEVTAKSIEAPGQVTIDDAFARSLGLDSLAKLKDAVKARLQGELDAFSRQRLKRSLLDALDERHKFDVPAPLVEQEFENLWQTAQAELQREGKTLADEGTTEEAAKADYRKIAERRVRLGLVLGEIGEKNNIKVLDEEVTRALVERARQFPGQEKQMWDFYQKNPSALASLRAPIFEDKVVDFLLEFAKVSDKPVSREELFRQDEPDAA